MNKTENKIAKSQKPSQIQHNTTHDNFCGCSKGHLIFKKGIKNTKVSYVSMIAIQKEGCSYDNPSINVAPPLQYV